MSDRPLPAPITDTDTRLLCVLGHPVSHSLSPRLHSAAIAATGLNAVYLAFDVAPTAFEAALQGLIAVNLLGANITIPHKAAALAFADTATQEATFIGAANTLFWNTEGRLVADNTDAIGLLGVLGEDCSVTAGQEVVIFGAGGAARAAAVALGRLQAAVTVRARDSEAARVVAELARRAGGAPPSGAAARVVINATPLGRHGESLPPELMSQGKGQVALDLNYGDRSPFLVQAARRGAVTVDGLAMLIGQAEAAFARWAGTPPPQGVMSAAVAKSPVRTADAHEDSTSRCTTE